jgi:hypothetical protein
MSLIVISIWHQILNTKYLVNISSFRLFADGRNIESSLVLSSYFKIKRWQIKLFLMHIKSFESSFSWKGTFKHYIFRSLFLKFKFYIINSYFFILIPFTIWKLFKSKLMLIFIFIRTLILYII